MKECKFCGSRLPDYAHFCASCGHVIDELNQENTYISNLQALDMLAPDPNTPPLVSGQWDAININMSTGLSDLDIGTTLPWSGEVNIPGNRQFQEHRTDENQVILPGMMLFAAQMAEGQAPAGNAPLVQGTPQVNGVPAVQGTPAAPAHPAGAQALFHNAPASAPAAPSAPSWVPHTTPPEAPTIHDHRHQTSGELHTHHHRRPHRRHMPRPHGTARHLLIATVVVVVIATSAVTGALALFRPGLSLSVNGGITPGGTFQLHGHNFTPGSSVTLTLDQGVPLSAIGHDDGGVASYGAEFANVLHMPVAVERSRQATASNTSIPVSIQGTFDATIHVGQDLSAGVHTIHATDRVLGRSADLQFTIPPAQTQPAELVVTPSSVLDFGSLETGRKVALPVIIGNTGGGQLHWSADVGSTSWLKAQPASGIVLPGHHEEVVNIIADASQLAAKDYSSVLHINSDAGNALVAVKLKVIPHGSGSSTKAILDVNPPGLNFGTQTVGAQVTMSVTLANSGSQALSWGADAGNAGWLKLSSNSGNILPGGLPQILSVTADTSQLAVGNHSATLNITSNGGNKQIAVIVAVKDAPPTPAALAVNPPALDFGKMDSGTTKTLQETVSNSGGQALTWNLNTTSLPGWLSVDRSSDTIQANGSETINVTVSTANLKPGPYTATLNLTSNGGNKSVQVSLTVNTPQLTPPLLCLGPNPLDFGTLDSGGATKTLQETICNKGGQPLTWKLDTASLPGWLSVNTNSGTVQAGSSQTINVTADTAGLPAGPQPAATLNFTSNGGNAQVSVTLTVNPPPPVMGVSPNPLDFGSVTAGQSVTLQETVSNSGGQPLNWSLDTSSLPSWLTVSANTGTVQSGGRQQINVTVNSSNLKVGGPYTATLNFTSSNGGGSAQVSVTFTVVPPIG